MIISRSSARSFVTYLLMFILGLLFIWIGFYMGMETGGGLALLGTVMFFVGAVKCKAPYRTVINSLDGTMLFEENLMVPDLKETFMRDGIKHIFVSPRLQSTGRSSYTTLYSVGIKLKTGGETIIAETGDSSNACSTARQLATFINLPLLDSTSGAPVLKAPDEFEIPLSHRLKKSKVPAIEALPLPTTDRLTISPVREGRKLTIKFGLRQPQMDDMIIFLVFLGITLPVLSMKMYAEAAGIAVTGALLSGLYWLTERQRVTIDHEKLTVTHLLFFIPFSKSLPLDSLVNLEIVDPKARMLCDSLLAEDKESDLLSDRPPDLPSNLPSDPPINPREIESLPSGLWTRRQSSSEVLKVSGICAENTEGKRLYIGAGHRPGDIVKVYSLILSTLMERS